MNGACSLATVVGGIKPHPRWPFPIAGQCRETRTRPSSPRRRPGFPPAENPGKLKIGKINIDENLELARRFEVMSIPTLILFKDGDPCLRIVGAKGKGQLLQELHPFL